MKTESPIQILAVNAGGSTLKLVLFMQQADQLTRIAGEQYSINDDDPAAKIQEFVDTHTNGPIDAAVHRIVHGGKKLGAPCIIDDLIEQAIAVLRSLAPLHNPAALKWVRASRRALGDQTPQIAVFDTAFYQDLPEVAQRYALPQRWLKKYPIRRFGFHGLAHHAMWKRWCGLNPTANGKGRIISLQLGSGCSITAIQDGKALDTSTGFSPMEGLVMATRAGDLDSGLMLYLQEQEELTSMAMQRELNQRSGLLGLSGISGDMHVLLASTETNAQLAIDSYCYRVRKYIGAYLSVLGGADAILFGGGVGENEPVVRAKILQGMQWSGIELEMDANGIARGCDALISTAQSSVKVWAVSSDEAAIMAEQAAGLIADS